MNKIVQKLAKGFRLSVCTASALFSIYVTVNLICFLSQPKLLSTHYNWIFNLDNTMLRIKDGMTPLIFDALMLLLLFILHYILKTARFVNFMDNWDFYEIRTSLSTLLFSLLLFKLISVWQPVKSIVFWYVDLRRNKRMWYAFVTAHTLAWFTVFATSIYTDFSKMMAVTHVINEMLHNDNAYRNYEAEMTPIQGILLHLSFLCLLIILWGVNLMSLDRVLIASAFTIFLFKNWYYDGLKRVQPAIPNKHED